MKLLKRRIAVILAFAMILGLKPVAVIPVYAKTPELIEEDVSTGDTVLCEESEEPLLLGSDDIAADGIADIVSERTFDNIRWRIDGYGCLYVSGTNDFKYSESDYAPWYYYRNDIKSAEINLTNYTRWLSRMFDGCTKLEKVTFKSLETGSVTDISNMFRGCSSLKVIDATKISPKTDNLITNMSGLFDGCSSLTEIYTVEYKPGTNNVLAMFDTSYCTNMSNMFRGCTSLTGLDLGKFDTTKVTNMNNMFSGCNSLAYLDLSRFNMINVAYADGMLNCSNLVSVNSPKFPTNSGKTNVEIDLPGNGWMRTDHKTPVTTLNEDIPAGTLVTTNNPSEEDKIYAKGNIKEKVFWTIYKDGTLVVTGNGEIRDPMTADPPWLEHKDMIRRADIDLAAAYDLSKMFQGCSSLSMANLSRLNTSDAIDMSYMFDGCSSMTSVDISGFTAARVTGMTGMFKDCSALVSIDLFHLDTTKVTDMSEMFSGCVNLTDIDFTGSDTGKLKGKPRLFGTPEVRKMSDMFKDCSSLKELDLKKFDLKKTTDVSGMLDGCEALEKLYSPANRQMKIVLPRCDATPLGVWKNNSDTKRYNTIQENTPAGTLFTFETENGEYENVRWWIDREHVLHVEGTGNFCAPNGQAPWSAYVNDILTADINLTESTDLSKMFDSCHALTSITWRNNTMTDTCTNMFGMFRGCKSLANVDLGDFNTSRVTDMSYMFEGCELMQTISVEGFDTSAVIDMQGMFRNCTGLKELDLSNFDMSSISLAYRVDKMLENCTALGRVLAPDKLSVKLFLPSIEKKGWRLKDDDNIPPARFAAIPAKTDKGTEFITAEDITKITLFEGDGTTAVKPSYDLEPGQTLKIVAKIEPVSADPLEIKWDTADMDIASVSPQKSSINSTAGTIEVTVTAGDKAGNALITASFGDAEPQMFTVRVSSMLKLTPSLIDIISGESIENAIAASVTDTGYDISDLIWESEYPKVLKVTPTATGASLESKSGITSNRKIKVTASTPDGKYSDICIVTIVPDPDPEPDWGDIEEQYIKDIFSDDLTKVPAGLWYLMPGNEGLEEGEVEYRLYMGSDVLDYSRTYTGLNITFDEEIRVYYGVRRLWRGRDYSIIYRNNRFAADSNDRKPPYFIINGEGSFQNSAEFKFNILPADINIASLYSDQVVPIDTKTKLATIQPNLHHGGNRLVSGRDYVLTYYKNEIKEENRIDSPKNYPAQAGENYYIEIAGKDGSDFTGTWNDPIRLVTINPADKSVVRMSKVRVKTTQLQWSEEPYSLKNLFDNTNPDNDAFAVTYEGYELVYGTDFTVDDVELADSGLYTIKLHGTANVSSGGYSFVGERDVKLEIKGISAKKISFAAFTNLVYYTGDVITMEDLHEDDSSGLEKVTLYTNKDGRQQFLTEGKDYEYEMTNSGATGKFDLVVRLKGEYNGVITKTIRVLRYDISKDKNKILDIDVENTTFCRAGAKPNVRVYFDGRQLAENIDYKLSYKNNNSLGDESDGFRAPQVVVTGIGNFSGKTSVKFTIGKAKLENIRLLLEDKDYKAKFSKNYYKSTPRLMDNGVLVKIGKGKDLEFIDRTAYVYGYADGGVIPENITGGIADGTLIEVSVHMTASEKSPYEAGSLTVKGYYRFVSKYRNLKNAKISLATPTEMICSDTEEEIMDALEKNLRVTIKDENNSVVNLIKDRDYEIASITNYMYPGNATITIKGLNEYSGTVNYEFKMYRRRE